jgi:hypothetical protein
MYFLQNIMSLKVSIQIPLAPYVLTVVDLARYLRRFYQNRPSIATKIMWSTTIIMKVGREEHRN